MSYTNTPLRGARALMISACRRRVRSLLAMVLVIVLAAGVIVGLPGIASAVPPISLNNAEPFGVLVGNAVSNTNQTAITGDLGVSPGSSVVGFPPGTVSGSTHAGDGTAAAAKSDLDSAYDDAAGRTPTATVGAALGGTTKNPGVYASSGSSFTITGTLTLDAQGDPDALFVFQATTLTTANASNINLLRGAQADNVFWQLSGTATLGTNSTFRGNVMASGNVTVSSGAALYGRAFSIDESAILQGTTSGPKTRIVVPNDPPTTTSLNVSPTQSLSGQTVTLTATVAAVTGSVIPQGEVVFKDGSTTLDSDFVNASGIAAITTSSLGAGSHQIMAVYLGGDTADGEAIIHFAPSKSSGAIANVSNSLWDNQATPAVQSNPDSTSTVLGVKFRAATTGTVRGIRFYKGAQNTGTHTGSLWTSDGQSLASVTFSGESASGWQQANFSTPVAIDANTTYVASYHTTSGHFSYTLQYFTSQYTSNPLIALADGAQGGNGVYTYSGTNTFPTSSYQATNYWVDVVFAPSDTLWPASAAPAVQSNPDTSPVVLGVKFRAATTGTVRGIRFYKGSQNTGTHVGSLWTSGGQSLASVTFSGESASGWQQAYFATPVTISANTTYIASYHTVSGHFSYTLQYFTSQYANYPLTALESGASGGNCVYTYSATNTFPTSTYQSTNYWVDVLFT
ncbi:DUF4082 domain-containing protein [Nonomuraea sp. NPDC049269]|uniref:DUF4082 domain-containing protein n=1 Tax=Nonomuraea sp. NPDC049269 TaxID=3364349 RepID=UPI00371AD170